MPESKESVADKKQFKESAGETGGRLLALETSPARSASCPPGPIITTNPQDITTYKPSRRLTPPSLVSIKFYPTAVQEKRAASPQDSEPPAGTPAKKVKTEARSSGGSGKKMGRPRKDPVVRPKAADYVQIKPKDPSKVQILPKETQYVQLNRPYMIPNFAAVNRPQPNTTIQPTGRAGHPVPSPILPRPTRAFVQLPPLLDGKVYLPSFQISPPSPPKGVVRTRSDMDILRLVSEACEIKEGSSRGDEVSSRSATRKIFPKP